MTTLDEPSVACRVAALRTAIEALDPVTVGWSLLWRGRRPEPWAEEATPYFDAVASDPSGCGWTVRHHLAVAHHARAYDLEAAGSPDAALPHWAAAAGQWARLHADPEFWSDAAARVRAMFTGRSDCDDAVAAVRDRLPTLLLTVHVDLARHHYAAGRVRSAAAHTAVIRDSDMPPPAVGELRRDLAAGPLAEARDDVERGQFGRAFGSVGGWLDVDPSNPWLLTGLLSTSNAWIESLNRQGSWFRPVGRLLQQVRERLRDARLLPVDPDQIGDGVLARELARHLSWAGFHALLDLLGADPHRASRSELERSRHWAQDVVGGLRTALRLDPTLGRDSYFHANRDLCRALVRLAEIRLLLGDPPDDLRGLLDEAADLDPTDDSVPAFRARLGGGIPAATVRALILAREPRWIVDALDRFADGVRTAADAEQLRHLLREARALVDTPDRSAWFATMAEFARRVAAGESADALRPTPRRADRPATASPEPGRAPAQEPVPVPERITLDVDNPWRWSADTNPYRSHAFATLGMAVPPRRRREVTTAGQAAVARARHGDELPAIRSAQDRLKSPEGFLLEDLRSHRPHPVAVPLVDGGGGERDRPPHRPADTEPLHLNSAALLDALDDAARTGHDHGQGA